MSEAHRTNSVPKLPLAQAAAKLVLLGVRTRTDFENLCMGVGEFKNKQRPADVPRLPIRYYNDEVKYWVDFIEQGIEYLQAGGEVPQVPTLKELTLRVHALGIDTKNGYYSAAASGELGVSVPAHPDTLYSNESFDWETFLAKGKSRFTTFKHARELMKGTDMMTIRDWREYSRKGRRPRIIPSIPHKYYADEWVSWPHFFSNEDKEESGS